MRRFIRGLVLDVFSIGAKPAKGVHILNGHFLSRSQYDKPEIFEAFLKSLSHNCEFIPVEEAAEMVLSGRASEFDGVGVAFTFDDGFLDCYAALAPALERYKVNACFFINPGFVNGDESYRQNFTEAVVLTEGKRPMSWQQIRELQDRGFVIGNHTLDHVRLVSDDRALIERQIVESKVVLERELGKGVQFFAWPYGQFADINEAALSVALSNHKYVFSGAGYREYLSFGGRVLNRRHFEADWKVGHLNYFMSHGKVYC